MAFLDSEVGLERGAVKFSPAREPRIMDRFQEGGPMRAATASLTGSPILVEYLQDEDDVHLVLRWENLSEAEATALRSLADAAGPLTAKLTKGTSDTETCGLEALSLEPLIGHYPESAPATPSALRRWRAEVHLLRLE